MAGPYTSIVTPIPGQPISSSQFGIPVKQAIDDLHNRTLTIESPSVETVTANIGTVASGFVVNDVRAATLCNGKLVDLDLYIQNTNAITASSGNLADTLMFTLLPAYRPSHSKSCSFGNGSIGGEAIINSDGTIFLRAASDSMAAGGNIRMSSMYIKS